MRKTLIAIAAAAAMVLAGAWATTPADEDRTRITQCDALPASVSIEVFTSAETGAICNEMLRILDGVTIADLRFFSKAVGLLSKDNSEKYLEITHDLVEIIRLRGLAYKEPRWAPTLDIVWKTWQGERGLISPHDIREFLASAGPDAAKL